MATFYLDYEGGNDANDGTTFANRWKTITSGATAARIAPGDTVRIMASPDPTSLGINATWTNKSATVTLASALNALITNCDTAWTASANVTCTVDTAYRTSTGAAKMAIAAGFTTGLAAYFALGGAQNYSGYQGITLWAYVSAALAASTLSIRLCSDAAGVTTVDTLPIPAISQTGQWVPIYIDKGSALGASIQSIALYADADPGTINITLDNISTTKAAGNDCLNLQTLIGKNTGSEYFWAIRAINGTTVTLDGSPGMANSVTANGYYGTTESVTTYIRKTIPTALVSAADTAVQSIQDSGSAGNLITFSGGWNRTDMTTQTGETYFDGQSGYGRGIDTNAKSFTNIDKINLIRYYRGLVVTGADQTIGTVKSGNCTQSGFYFSSNSRMTATALHAYGCYSQAFENLNGDNWNITTMKGISCGMSVTNNGWAVNGATMVVIGTLELSNCNWSCLTGVSNNKFALWRITTLTTNDCSQVGFAPTYVDNFEIGTHNASGCGAAISMSSMLGKLLIGSAVYSGNGYNMNLATSLPGAELVILSLTSSGSTTAGIHMSTMGGIAKIFKSTLSDTTKLAFDSAAPAGGYLVLQNYNGTAGDHRYYGISGGSSDPYAQIFSESSVRHTASGLAWKLSPKSTQYVTADFPIVLPIARVACNASALVTFKVWMRRTNTGLTGTLRCRGGQIGGVAADVTDSIGAVADTWEEQTITFTPNEAGVVDIDVLCYGGTTYSLYVDDITITQA